MNVIKTNNYSEMSQKAAIVIASHMIRNPQCVLGLATGSTPEGMYEELIGMYKKSLIDFSQITTFNLDEYYNLPGDHSQSYRSFMREKLFDHVNINENNIHIPNGEADDPAAECERYEKSIDAAGGMDIQILGIGQNGHIGFNEPDVRFASMTHLVDLAESTRKANQRFFPSLDDVPRQAMSMGINTIMKSKNILLIANGAEKMDALHGMIEGPVTPALPASILQVHPSVLVLYCES